MQAGNDPHCPFIRERIKCRLFTRWNITHKRKEPLLIHGIASINPTGITLYEKSQTQKGAPCMIPFNGAQEQAQLIDDIAIRTVVTSRCTHKILSGNGNHVGCQTILCRLGW